MNRTEIRHKVCKGKAKVLSIYWEDRAISTLDLNIY